MLTDGVPIRIDLHDTTPAPILRRGRVSLSLVCGAIARVAMVLPSAILVDEAGAGWLLHASIVVVLTAFGLSGISWRRVPGTASVLLALVPAAAWTGLALSILLASPDVHATDGWGNALPSPFVVLAARVAATGAVSSGALLLAIAFFAALAVLSVKPNAHRSLSERLDAPAAILPIGAMAVSAFVHGATDAYVSILHVSMWAGYGVLAMVALTLAPQARYLARIEDPEARARWQRTAALVPVAFTLGVLFLSCAWPLMLCSNAVGWAVTAPYSAHHADVGAAVSVLPRDLLVDGIIAMLASGARVLTPSDVRAHAHARWGRLLVVAIALSLVLAGLGAVTARLN